MPTQCSRDLFGFAPVEGRRVELGLNLGDRKPKHRAGERCSGCVATSKTADTEARTWRAETLSGHGSDDGCGSPSNFTPLLVIDVGVPPKNNEHDEKSDHVGDGDMPAMGQP
jgi:hypothetical protein